MNHILELWLQSCSNLVITISQPTFKNNFYFLVMISIVFWLWELVLPWRKKQDKIRKDFWLDTFYMFFNMHIFPILGFTVFSTLLYQFLKNLLLTCGITSMAVINLEGWPHWVQLFVLFLIRDFIQWNTHRLLHRIPFLWEIHKVHHSVEQMGFAAHLRYHWMENIIYRLAEFIPLSLLNLSVRNFSIIYAVSLIIGHFNHSNIKVHLNWLKYIINNPQMHIWHHAVNIPKQNGVNFGLTLSIWDYIFQTVYIPHEGKEEKLGFLDIDKFPKGFWKQATYPWSGKD